jgi:hypothetical protein
VNRRSCERLNEPNNLDLCHAGLAAAAHTDTEAALKVCVLNPVAGLKVWNRTETSVLGLHVLAEADGFVRAVGSVRAQYDCQPDSGPTRHQSGCPSIAGHDVIN